MRTNDFFCCVNKLPCCAIVRNFLGFAILYGWKRRTNIFINIISCSVKMWRERGHVEAMYFITKKERGKVVL
jgi:hypothetical protein